MYHMSSGLIKRKKHEYTSLTGDELICHLGTFSTMTVM